MNAYSRGPRVGFPLRRLLATHLHSVPVRVPAGAHPVWTAVQHHHPPHHLADGAQQDRLLHTELPLKLPQREAAPEFQFQPGARR